MSFEKGVLVDDTEDITSSDKVTLLKFGVWGEVPLLVLIKAW
jgi:hypothetical protein